MADLACQLEALVGEALASGVRSEKSSDQRVETCLAIPHDDTSAEGICRRASMQFCSEYSVSVS